MDKLYAYFGKNKITVEVDNSQKLFSPTSKIKKSVKPDTSYVDKALCDIPDPPEDTIKVPEVPVVDIPTPPNQIEIPKSLIASFLPCAKEGLFPCPELRITETFEMTDEELNECNKWNALRIPVRLAMDYKKPNSDYDLKDDEPPAIDDIIGYAYIRPFFQSKCCCEAEDDEDVIDIRLGWRFKHRRPRFRLPKIKFPCPDIKFKSKVKSKKDGSGGGNSREDVGKIELDVKSEVDEEDCRKMKIKVDMLFSIPRMVKALRWENVSENGCIVTKKLVVDWADIIIIDDQLQFGPVIETEDLFFMPIQEQNCENESPPVNDEITVIGSIDYHQDKDETTINWQELKLKFCCGRLVGVTTGNSDSVTIETKDCNDPSSEESVSSEETWSSEDIVSCWETTMTN